MKKSTSRWLGLMLACGVLLAATPTVHAEDVPAPTPWLDLDERTQSDTSDHEVIDTVMWVVDGLVQDKILTFRAVPFYGKRGYGLSAIAKF